MTEFPGIGDIEVIDEWQSLHWYYMNYAIDSSEVASSQPAGGVRSAQLNRAVVETIRYSYDAIDASIGFTLHMGQAQQLRFTPPENWLSRYLARHWRRISLAERLGALAFAWKGEPFWLRSEQTQLFCDLQLARDYLTHPTPAGVRVSRRIEDIEEIGGLISTVSTESAEPVVLNPSRLSHGRRAIATFSNHPFAIGPDDADQAVEIMLHHLERLERLFWRPGESWFARIDPSTRQVLTLDGLISKSKNRFRKYWQ